MSPKTATVAEKYDCRRKRRLSHFSATDSRTFRRQSPFSVTKLSPKSATIVASVMDRLLDVLSKLSCEATAYGRIGSLCNDGHVVMAIIFVAVVVVGVIFCGRSCCGHE